MYYKWIIDSGRTSVTWIIVLCNVGVIKCINDAVAYGVLFRVSFWMKVAEIYWGEVQESRSGIRSHSPTFYIVFQGSLRDSFQ